MNSFTKKMFEAAISDLSDAQKDDMAESAWEELAILKELDISWSDAKELLSKEFASMGEEEDLVLPRDVADYLERCKERGHSLFGAFGQINRKKVPARKMKVIEWIESNSEKFALAWISGEYAREPEEEFFWRKKEEFCASFETLIYLQENVGTKKPTLTSDLSRPFSKSEAKRLLGKDFSMFEKEEITDSVPSTDDHPY